MRRDLLRVPLQTRLGAGSAVGVTFPAPAAAYTQPINRRVHEVRFRRQAQSHVQSSIFRVRVARPFCVRADVFKNGLFHVCSIFQ